MIIRYAEEKDYLQLAEMKWQHGAEDDIDYGEHNFEGMDKQKFIDNFVNFLYSHKGYKIFIAEENDKVISAEILALLYCITASKPSSALNSFDLSVLCSSISLYKLKRLILYGARKLLIHSNNNFFRLLHYLKLFKNKNVTCKCFSNAKNQTHLYNLINICIWKLVLTETSH